PHPPRSASCPTRRSSDLIDPITLALLRLSCYEMRFRLDVPYKVVINESLRLSKKFGATDSYKFLNGVLDRVATRLRSTEIQARGDRKSTRLNSSHVKISY